MADNLGGLIAYIQDELNEPAEETVIRRYIRDFLFNIRSERFRFSEESGTFSTVASQSDYPTGVDGVPGDIIKIDRLRVLNGSVYSDVRERQIDEFREIQSANIATSNRPQDFCFYAEQILFWPTPSAVTTIYLDYQVDPTRDYVTGSVFTEDAEDTFTNAYFREARDLMVSFCMMKWGLGRGQNPELANQQSAVYKNGLSRLRQEYARIKMGDGRMTPHL